MKEITEENEISDIDLFTNKIDDVAVDEFYRNELKEMIKDIVERIANYSHKIYKRENEITLDDVSISSAISFKSFGVKIPPFLAKPIFIARSLELLIGNVPNLTIKFIISSTKDNSFCSKKKSVDNSKVLTKFLPTSVFIYKFNFS